MPVLDAQIDLLDRCTAPELRGTVKEVRGLALRVATLPAPIGAMVEIFSHAGNRAQSPPIPGEVVGFDGRDTVVMPLGSASGVSRGDHVVALHNTQQVRVGPTLLGRVLNGMGEPIDGQGPLRDTVPQPLHPEPVDPLDRPLIDQPLATGMRVIDAMTPLGMGQRMGVFASPGVGKSTLLASCAKHTAADVSVIALIGERGREVKDFIEKALGADGMARSVVVCATSDESALMRLRAAWVGTSIAEYFRDQGLNVMLVMDSVTRFCQAQRQVGLAAGEPPATKGYPPSVFATLPKLLERSGRTSQGSITGLYSVLVEGGDMDEPIADACRGILDGHLLLDRKLAEQGHYPAIDVPGSISRVADDVTDANHQQWRRQVLKLIAAHRQVEDLVNIGAYAAGSNPDFDLAITCKPAIDRLLQQGRGEVQGQADFLQTTAQLQALAQLLDQTKQQLQAQTRANIRRS
ncbi:FliI/YscN family ATPase [Algisphaera agarilytica]|uniref:FliI/YscN family ATPase n=1 Tax=Algisphaera agarilytica TaxID=1385975 RepID=A0A7X0LLB7_9BACT|nr:FliI/YscN family ATPase [Algisphaera agarilytica]MBB6430739.1 FliI/YscN family ATPase [Algisphaera agarilytica]